MKLIKIDKNGTKHYAETRCSKCGGAGGSDAWAYTGWTCYRCGGSGIDPKPSIVKEYTPEYAEKLRIRREKAAEKKRLELVALSFEANKEFLENAGFNAEGKSYYVLGKTFEIREELKAAGAKFDAGHKSWRLPTQNEKYQTIEVDVNEVYYKDYADTFQFRNEHHCSSDEYKSLEDKLNALNNEIVKHTVVSQYFGEEGKRYTLNLKYISKAEFASKSFVWYQEEETKYIYKFEDENGNIFCWKTTKYLDIKVGEIYKITGTVKSHDEYKFVPQTWLTRCKLG